MEKKYHLVTASCTFGSSLTMGLPQNEEGDSKTNSNRNIDAIDGNSKVISSCFLSTAQKTHTEKAILQLHLFFVKDKVKFEDFLKLVGENGRWQIVIFLFTWIEGALIGCHHLSSSFLVWKKTPCNDNPDIICLKNVIILGCLDGSLVQYKPYWTIKKLKLVPRTNERICHTQIVSMINSKWFYIETI